MVAKKILNILVVGAAGCGKSALCNVLTGSNEFEEVPYAVNEIRNIQSGCFNRNREYRIFDTFGIGSTNQAKQEILKIKNVKNEIKKLTSEKLWRVLLVTDGRLSEEEAAIYDSVKNKFKESQVTVVRTNFNKFRNEDDCNNDREAILKNKNIAKIARTIERYKFIHVDNPPIDIEWDDESDRIYVEMQNNSNRETREMSRNILLDHFDKLK